MLARAAVVRGWEAQVAAVLIGPVTSGATRSDPARATYHWGLGTDLPHGLIVTPECSAATVIGPLLLLAAGAVLISRLDPARVAIAVGVSGALMVTVNLVRLVMIAWAIDRFGPEDGYWWAHVVAGSLLSLGGFVAGLAVAVVLGGASLRDTSPPTAPGLRRWSRSLRPW